MHTLCSQAKLSIIVTAEQVTAQLTPSMKREREEDERDIIDISSDSGSDSASSDGEDELPGHQNPLFAEDEFDDENATMGGNSDSDDEGDYVAKEEEDLEDVVDDSAPRRSPSVAPAERGDVLVDLLKDRTPEETGPSFNALPLDI